MGFQCGIVGLPNVGKSTLFNALTRAGAEASNYPFCTIEPNIGTVPVPDERLAAIAEIVNPQNVLPAVMRFVDIAGLIAGAAEGEGLGNKFLAHIREVQAIAHIVRCYEDDDITHVTGRVDPAADIEVINTELALADLEAVEKAIAKLARQLKTGDKAARAAESLLKRVHTCLADGNPVRSLTLTPEEQAQLAPYQFLTSKPVLYVANIGENDLQNSADNPQVAAVKQIAAGEGAQVVILCASLEAEIAAFDDAEKEAFLADFKLEEPGLNRLIRAGYNLLGLQTFFTAGVKEVRAWTIRAGDTAPVAAGVIHSDFEKRFIRAEVVAYKDFIAQGGEQGAKAAGVWQLEGKDYCVQDGDVIFFRTSA